MLIVHCSVMTHTYNKHLFRGQSVTIAPFMLQIFQASLSTLLHIAHTFFACYIVANTFKYDLCFISH